MFQKYRNIRQLKNAEVIHYNFVNELLHHNEETLTNHGARTSPAYTRRRKSNVEYYSLLLYSDTIIISLFARKVFTKEIILLEIISRFFKLTNVSIFLVHSVYLEKKKDAFQLEVEK